MEELVNFMERVPKAQSATCWKNKEIQRWVGKAEDAPTETVCWKYSENGKHFLMEVTVTDSYLMLYMSCFLSSHCDVLN